MLRYGQDFLGRTYVPHKSREYVNEWCDTSGLGQPPITPYPWRLDKPTPKELRAEKMASTAQLVAVVGGVLGIIAALSRWG